METRVVTIVDGSGDDAGAASLVAENLAAEMAYAGGSVLLADATDGQRCSSWARARTQARMHPRVAVAAVQREGYSEFLEHAADRFGHIVIDAGAARGRSSLSALIIAQAAVVVFGPNASDADRFATLAARLSEARLFNPALRVLCVALREDAPDGAPRPCLQGGVNLLGPSRMASTSLQLAALRSGCAVPGQCSRDLHGGGGPFSSLWREINPQPAWRISRQFFKR